MSVKGATGENGLKQQRVLGFLPVFILRGTLCGSVDVVINVYFNPLRPNDEYMRQLFEPMLEYC